MVESIRLPAVQQHGGASPLRDSAAALQTQIASLARRIGRKTQFMEVCGTHTVSIFRTGIRGMLPPNVRMLSGPGCPVCVTAQRDIDAAIELAARPGVILATYGDMLRVPGRLGSLERQRAAGADVRVVTSARAALRIARENPQREVVFLAVGFETTAPATAAVIRTAESECVKNFSALVSHKLVVPAMRALLDAGDVRLDGFLCPGHVSVIIGAEAYRPIVDRYRQPCVVAGFEPLQILRGIAALLTQVARREARLENVYTAAVPPRGNAVALHLLAEVFAPSRTAWRELGEIPGSGLELAPRYCRFDAARRFGITLGPEVNNPACLCGQVICGRAEPSDCALFRNGCTPLTPIGPCMVSSEGTCAAWFKYAAPRPSAEAAS
ncbi:Hydrogenase isoenzymes formation protein HypD [Phycisphaerae bacterium RAS1]|nr:Hydrogenase isoenzymes formation protein HypD [Phycisphaerae bacterium RAS1]